MPDRRARAIQPGERGRGRRGLFRRAHAAYRCVQPLGKSFGKLAELLTAFADVARGRLRGRALVSVQHGIQDAGMFAPGACEAAGLIDGRSGLMAGLIRGRISLIPIETAIEPVDKVTPELCALAEVLAR